MATTKTTKITKEFIGRAIESPSRRIRHLGRIESSQVSNALDTAGFNAATDCLDGENRATGFFKKQG